MMIVVDGDVNIHDNLAVARHISKHVDPETDIIFTQGPMDILDHACSKPSFGGKMGIDATHKLEEELRTSRSAAIPQVFASINEKEFREKYPEIKGINDSLLKYGISLVFVSVEKSRKGHIKELNSQLFMEEAFREVKVVIYLDGTRKTKEHDGFSRDWPNILASRPETIERIDAIWDKLGLGELIPSPSRTYLKQLYKGGAVAEED